MTIGIIGTGTVARTLAGRFLELGHTVFLGTRDARATLARTATDQYGNPPIAQWLAAYPKATLTSFKEAATRGELIVNASSGIGSLQALSAAGAQSLRNKILIDIANPLDFSKGFPPSLSVCNTDSLAEQIQKAFPEAKVVKTLNTMTALVMVNPQLVPGDHNVFLSGNDADAKKQVAGLLTGGFGWKPSNVIDLGDITSARATEMLLPIWVRLFSTLKNPVINFHIAIGSPAPRS